MLERLLTDSVEVQRQTTASSGRTPLPGWGAVGTFTGALLDTTTAAQGVGAGEPVGDQQGARYDAVAIFALPAPDVRPQDRVRVAGGAWQTVQTTKGGRRSPLRAFCQRTSP